MNVKQKKTRASKMTIRTLKLREELWQNLDESTLWSRHNSDGYSTIPRLLPLIHKAMDELAGKGKPVSTTYFTLWCRVFDESLVTITSPHEMAYEASFSGQRAVTTWTGRMKILSDLGFIKIKSGKYGQHSYVLILNPFHVIKHHYENGNVRDELYVAIFSRAQEVGASDLS